MAAVTYVTGQKNASGAPENEERQRRNQGAEPSTLCPFTFARQIRHTRIANRVIFGPVCPTWVRSPHEGVFTEQAVAYCEERARTGRGMIILGGHLIDKDTLYTPAGFPGLWNEDQVEGLARVARAVKKHDCALIAQLLHIGLRSPTPFLKTDPARDPYEYNPYMLGPSQMPVGEIPRRPDSKGTRRARDRIYSAMLC